MSENEKSPYGVVSHFRPHQGERKAFEQEDFDPQAYIINKLLPVEEEEVEWNLSLWLPASCCCAKEQEQHDGAANTRNELMVMCAELKNLRRISAKQMIKCVIANYTFFIRSSREVADLEEDVHKLRSLLRTQTAMVQSLAAEGWRVPSTNTKPSDVNAICFAGEDRAPSMYERRATSLPDIFDSLLAERKVDQALSALEEGEKLVQRGLACSTIEGDLSPITPTGATFLQVALSERRTRLVEYLGVASQQPSVQGMELRSAIAALNGLGEGTRAHTLLLTSHHGRLELNFRGLRRSGTSYGGAFTAALSQMAFSAIAQAARDSVAVFGEVPAYASELVMWARTITEWYACLIKRHVLSSAAAAGGLRAAAECVQIALGHCSLLEAQGLTMGPLLSKLMRPSVEQAMGANLKRIEESVSVMASADDWVLTSKPTTPYYSSRLKSSGLFAFKLSSSAHLFNTMAQDFLEGVSPLISLRLAGVALEGLSIRFHRYIDMLIQAVPDPKGDGRVSSTNEIGRTTTPRSARTKEQTAVTEAQQLALLSNATALAYELLPRSAFKLLPGGKEPCTEFGGGACIGFTEREMNYIRELKNWREKLHKGVDRLQDHVCRHYVRLLLYCADKDEVQLSPQTYLSLDEDERGSTWLHQDPMPSLVFQAVFTKMTSVINTGEALGISNEKVVSVFLARFLETLVCWLDEDKFLSLIEDGPQRLGPNGLQQFVLDMQFVIQLASSGKCASRVLRLMVPELTSRAVSAFAATGADLNSGLPNDDWFLEAAQSALYKLKEGWNQPPDLEPVPDIPSSMEPEPEERMPRDF